MYMYAFLHKFRLLNKMVAVSHGTVNSTMHMCEVLCVLCAVKLEDKVSRINVPGRSTFPIEAELRKLQLNVAIDDSSHVCFPCLRKLKKRKSLEENLASAMEDLVKNHADFWK